ncbi:MAG: polyhydroxyalkanoic acid system family protein [Casimicrobiaceae bacterium]
MSQIHIRRAHHSTLAEARKMADQVAATLAEDYELKSNWEGNTLHFNRSGVSGSLAVGAEDFAIDVKLGLLMAAFKKPIQQAIESNLEKLIAQHAAKRMPAAAKSTGKVAAKKKPTTK